MLELSALKLIICCSAIFKGAGFIYLTKILQLQTLFAIFVALKLCALSSRLCLLGA